MTRKRFVKLLMAKGYDRNEANGRADVCRECGFSYEAAYQAIYRIDISDVFGRISEALNTITDTARKVCFALGQAAASFTETFRNCMDRDL